MLAGIRLRRQAMLGDAVVVIGLWWLLWALAALRRPCLARIPGLRALGARSYTFYMAYAPVEVVFSRLWRRLGRNPAALPWLWLPLVFLCDLTLAGLTTRFIERPALSHLAGRRPER